MSSSTAAPAYSLTLSAIDRRDGAVTVLAEDPMPADLLNQFPPIDLTNIIRSPLTSPATIARILEDYPQSPRYQPVQYEDDLIHLVQDQQASQTTPPPSDTDMPDLAELAPPPRRPLEERISSPWPEEGARASRDSYPSPPPPARPDLYGPGWMGANPNWTTDFPRSESPAPWGGLDPQVPWHAGAGIARPLNSPPPQPAPPAPRRPLCYHCGSPGHLVRNCPIRHPSSQNNRHSPLPRLRLPASRQSPTTRAHGALRDYLGHRMAEIDRQVRALQEERWYWSTADFRLGARPASPSPSEITRVQPDVESMHRWTQQRRREGEWEDTRPWQGGFARAWSDGSSS